MIKLGQAARRIYTQVVAELAKYGVTKYVLAWQKRHPVIRFDIAGKPFHITIGGSPSDVRADKNMVAFTRRLCERNGLTPLPKPRRRVVSPPDTPSTETRIPSAEPKEPTMLDNVQSVVEINDEPAPPAANQFWDAAHIRIEHATLYVPRPITQPVLVITVADDLLLERGDKLVIDVSNGKLYHLDPNHLEALYTPAHDTTVQEVLQRAVQPEQPVAAPAARAHTAGQPQAKNVRQRHQSGVAAQMGRVLVGFHHVQIAQRSDKITSSSVREVLATIDQRSLPALITKGQAAGFISKVGPVPGHAHSNYYRLTKQGQIVVKQLGDWPFAVAGMAAPHGGH